MTGGSGGGRDCVRVIRVNVRAVYRLLNGPETLYARRGTVTVVCVSNRYAVTDCGARRDVVGEPERISFY